MKMGYHVNTLRLIRIMDEILELGFHKRYPKKCFSYEIARATGELGEDYPSDRAVELAKSWLEEFKKTGRIQALEEEQETLEED